MKQICVQIALVLALCSGLVSTPASTAAQAVSEPKVCYRHGIDKITARGISCRRAKRVLGRAQREWYDSPGSPASLEIGSFKCRFPNEDLSFVVCRHHDTPKGRWAKWFSE